MSLALLKDKALSARHSKEESKLTPILLTEDEDLRTEGAGLALLAIV